VRAAGEPRAGTATAATAPAAVAPRAALPLVVAPVAAAHCAEIERLVRIGHVRGIETEINALAALAPEAIALAEQMRALLDSFDLKALAVLAKTGVTHGQ
jgi:hypothetical protein